MYAYIYIYIYIYGAGPLSVFFCTPRKNDRAQPGLAQPGSGSAPSAPALAQPSPAGPQPGPAQHFFVRSYLLKKNDTVSHCCLFL